MYAIEFYHMKKKFHERDHSSSKNRGPYKLAWSI